MMSSPPYINLCFSRILSMASTCYRSIWSLHFSCISLRTVVNAIIHQLLYIYFTSRTFRPSSYRTTSSWINPRKVFSTPPGILAFLKERSNLVYWYTPHHVLPLQVSVSHCAPVSPSYWRVSPSGNAGTSVQRLVISVVQLIVCVCSLKSKWVSDGQSTNNITWTDK